MKLIFITVCILAQLTLLSGQSIQEFQFNSEEWNLSLECSLVDFDGRKCLSMERSVDDSLKGYIASIKNWDFKDGTIEFDVYCPKMEEAEVGLFFRQTNHKNEDRYELFCIRPYATNKMGAIQYMPVNNGEINWPDYNHEVYQAVGEIPWGQWVTIKAEVEGAKATFYVDDLEVMTVPNLGRGQTIGKTGLWIGNMEQCYFSNFRVTVDSIVSGKTADGKKVYASSIENDQFIAGYVFDNNNTTRWSSEYSDPQWIMIDLGKTEKVGGVMLKWEAAYAKAYKVLTSADSINWTSVYATTDGNGGTDKISFEQQDARFLKVNGTERGTVYGYSLFEFEIHEKFEEDTLTNNSSLVSTVEFPTIYPNPVSDILTLETSYAIQGIAIYTLAGKQMNVPVDRHLQNQVHIELSSLQAGIYILKVHTDKGSFARKIMVN